MTSLKLLTDQRDPWALDGRSWLADYTFAYLVPRPGGGWVWTGRIELQPLVRNIEIRAVINWPSP